MQRHMLCCLENIEVLPFMVWPHDGAWGKIHQAFNFMVVIDERLWITKAIRPSSLRTMKHFHANVGEIVLSWPDLKLRWWRSPASLTYINTFSSERLNTLGSLFGGLVWTCQRLWFTADSGPNKVKHLKCWCLSPKQEERKHYSTCAMKKKKDIHSNNRAPKKNDKHFILRVRSLGPGSTATVKKITSFCSDF